MKHTIENQVQEQSKAKKTGLIKGLAATAAFIAISHGEAKAQNTATIDPINYKTAQTAYTIPNLPSGSDYYLAIKGGEKVYINIDGMDANTGSYYKATSPTKTVTGNTIQIIPGDPGNRLVSFTENGVAKTLKLHINYQADTYDRTDGSSTKNTRPDAIRVDPGQQAKLSAGPNMTNYSRKDLETGNSLGGDSIKIVGKGRKVAATNDGTKRTMDTIAVVERPVANNTTHTVNFATTVAGTIYKVYKGEKVGNDTVWNEVPSLSFTGDGNPRNVATGVGDFKVGALRRAGSDIIEAKDSKPLKVDLGTDVYEVGERAPLFAVANHTVYFKEAIKHYQIVDMSGRIIKEGTDNSISLEKPGAYIMLVEKANGKKTNEKIIIQ